MKKSILNLEGVKVIKRSELKTLNRTEQQTVNGGRMDCYFEWDYCDGGGWQYFDYCMQMLGCG
ncbi:hypothetical protein [uncultured Aquimarina sp.]|uniref:hypothetical protein n=1 Tax=uncultured Aquimarina sp. TaxID=575652 RepID=UPI002639C6BA|nr:hypothetical protein [uncultured Aquimarina sp.]